jgi:hypothetical protein
LRAVDAGDRCGCCACSGRPGDNVTGGGERRRVSCGGRAVAGDDNRADRRAAHRDRDDDSHGDDHPQRGRPGVSSIAAHGGESVVSTSSLA